MFQRLIQRESAIYLSEAKKPLLVRRLGLRLHALGLRSFTAYYRRLTRDADQAELQRMLDCISTNETRFFREPRQFEHLEVCVLPRWIGAAAEGRRARRLRAWCSACSTGEEPYSLAMVLHRACGGRRAWDLEVLASDLSSRAVEQARAAVWPLERAQEIPPRYRRAYVLKGTGEHRGSMRIAPEIRSLVRFAQLNLNHPRYEVASDFDLIFCRNALMYFHPSAKEAIIDRLLGHLAPGGLLFVGHAESLTNLTERVRLVIPTVYTCSAEQASEG